MYGARYGLTALLTLLTGCALRTQQPVVDVYQVRVITNGGNRVRGLLDEVTGIDLYLDYKRSKPHYRSEQIPLNSIRKVVIHRQNKKNAFLSGAAVGGLLTGFLSNQSLQKNQPSSPVAYGLTLTFAAAGGAATGLLVGSAIGNVANRVIRPVNAADPELSLFQQLEPFTIRYQQDLINRLPKNEQ